jgi:tRNA (guanine-N7-)-methyltransferase
MSGVSSLPADATPDEHRRSHIRSFSGRRGHITSGQRAAYDELLPRYGIAYQPTPVDLDAAFGRAAPVIMEIGFGMGEGTVQIATGRPDENFLGVEVYPAGVGSLLLRTCRPRV